MNVIYKMCSQIMYIYLMYIYKEDLALNNQQWLICYKSKANQTKSNSYMDLGVAI